MTNNPCRAKNPATCWKHGNGETVTLSGAQTALKTAKAELATADGFDSFAVTKKAIEKYERRVAFLKGKVMPRSEVDTAYNELVEDANTEYETALRHAITDPHEFESAVIPYFDVTDKLETESPAHAYEQLPLSLLSYTPEIIACYQPQWDAATSMRAEWESKGYKSATLNQIDHEITYFYKEDMSDPANYGRWTSVRAKHKDVIVNAERKRDNGVVQARNAFYAKRASLKEKLFAS